MTAQVIIRCKYSGNKFIVLENEKGEVVVFADDDTCFRLHKDLLEQYCLETGLNARCIGGGLINYFEEKKFISVMDESTDFGREPNRNETVAAIQQACTDFTVKGFE